MLSPEYPKEQLVAKVEYPSPDKLLGMEEAEANKELAKTIKHIADLPQKELEGAISDFIDHLLTDLIWYAQIYHQKNALTLLPKTAIARIWLSPSSN